MKKGDVLSVAQLAAIMGAKQTSNLIPLCHPLALTKVEVHCSLVDGESPACTDENHNTFGDMAVQSILAGSDILLVCHEYEHMQEAYNGLMKAVKDGRISKERLDESVKRILLMKMSRGL